MDRSLQLPTPDEAGCDFAAVLSELLVDSDDEAGGRSPKKHSIREELVEKVMHELYEEILLTGSSHPHCANPASTASSPSSTKADGSCGASVSDTASTVMAGVHFTCNAGELRGPAAAERVWGDGDGGGGGEGLREVVGIDGCDEVVVDDEWLEKALIWVAQVEAAETGKKVE